MRALTNAQADLAALAVEGGEKIRVMEAADAAAPDRAPNELKDLQAVLDGATALLRSAVAGLEAAESAGDLQARRNASATAKAPIEKAEAASRTVALRVVDLSRRSTGTPQEAEALTKLAAGAEALRDAAKSARIAADKLGNAAGISKRLMHSGLVVIASAMVFGLWRLFMQPNDTVLASSLFAWIVIDLTLIAAIARDAEHGLLGPIVGQDNRLSTSKTQAWLWTLAVGFAVAYLAAGVQWAGLDPKTFLDPELFDDYLLLLGGPFAAGVLAKLATSAKVEGGTLQKTEAEKTSPGQLIQNDAGNTDLIDSQYLMFNFIALGFFLVGFATKGVLPELPGILLGLTSASAVTYTANKAAERNPPLITALSPRAALPGQRLKVIGQNFLAGLEDPKPTDAAVLIEGHPGEIIPAFGSTGSELLVDLPISLTPGSKTLSVRTAAGVTTGSAIFEILDSAPALLGLQSAAVVGSAATLIGRNVLSPWTTAASEPVSVSVGGFQVPGEATRDDTGERITFVVPDWITPDTDVLISVTRGTSTSAPITVRMTKP